MWQVAWYDDASITNIHDYDKDIDWTYALRRKPKRLRREVIPSRGEERPNWCSITSLVLWAKPELCDDIISRQRHNRSFDTAHGLQLPAQLAVAHACLLVPEAHESVSTVHESCQLQVMWISLEATLSSRKRPCEADWSLPAHHLGQDEVALQLDYSNRQFPIIESKSLQSPDSFAMPSVMSASTIHLLAAERPITRLSDSSFSTIPNFAKSKAEPTPHGYISKTTSARDLAIQWRTWTSSLFQNASNRAAAILGMKTDPGRHGHVLKLSSSCNSFFCVRRWSDGSESAFNRWSFVSSASLHKSPLTLMTGTRPPTVIAEPSQDSSVFSIRHVCQTFLSCRWQERLRCQDFM